VSTVTTTDRETKPKGFGAGGPNNGSRKNGGGDGGDKNRNYRPTPDKYRLGIWLGIASIVMMFMAITSALVIRQGDDWSPISIPSALWLSTSVLFASSLTIEWARRSLKRGMNDLFKRWLSATMLLGVLFVAGQLLAWRQLVLSGIFLSTNPHSSFFYLMTGLHGLHLLGGIIALSWIVFGAWRNRFSKEQTMAVDATAIYWHFMDILWIYLFLLLFVWRN
jgi:cytochrome c oxidase subunit III